MKTKVNAAVIAGLLAAFSSAFAGAPSEDPNSIVIEYVGNSCFILTFPGGKTVITDPYGESLETAFAPRPAMKADVVTVSHLHTDHTGGIDDVKGHPRVIRPNDASMSGRIGSVKISGIAASHILGMGNNTIFVFKAGGFKIVHISETDTLDAKALDAVANADVVMMYAGELGTVKFGELYATLRKAGVRIVIPQHYSMRSDFRYYNEPCISDILAELPKETDVWTLNRLVLSKNMKSGVVVLNPTGLRERSR